MLPEIIHLTSTIDKNPPLAEMRFNEILSKINFTLPEDYLAFMRVHNGGQGFIHDGKFVRFWGFDELEQGNIDYDFLNYAPHLYIIGSDGGGEALTIRKDNASFVMVPWIGSIPEDEVPCGINFLTFLQFLALPW